MDNVELGQSMKEKLEVFLSRACEAEAKREFLEADRLFRLALYCEGRLRPDVTDAKEYVLKAEPVYKPVGTIAGPEITREQS